MTNWKLGENQRLALRTLRERGGWPGGWHMGSTSNTVRILDSLVKREFAKTIEETGDRLRWGSWTRYEITDAGREALEALGGIYADPKKAKPKTTIEVELDRLMAMSPNGLKVEFEKTMSSIGQTSNLASLADLARHAGMVWSELTGRGIEFR